MESVSASRLLAVLLLEKHSVLILTFSVALAFTLLDPEQERCRVLGRSGGQTDATAQYWPVMPLMSRKVGQYMSQSISWIFQERKS